MAVDPVTLIKAATTVGKIGSTESGRKIILVSILTPLILILVILASPFAIFFGLFHNGTDNVSIQVLMEELQNEFRSRVEEEQNDKNVDTITTIVLGSEDNTLIDNTVDVLSFFSAFYITSNGKQVAYLDGEDKRKLVDTFWEMNEITTDIEVKTKEKTSVNKNGEKNTKTVDTRHKTIEINSLTAEEMAEKYGFSDKQKRVLKEVKMSSENIMPTGNNMVLSKEEIEGIKANLPLDLAIERQQIVDKALSIVGKVHYFWGGKSSSIGWDNNWGTPVKVTSSGSSSTGKIKPYGLDCSGYVTWVFINMGIDSSTIEKTIGHGTTNQWHLSTSIVENQVKEGDLAFLAVPNTRKANHVGIVVGKDEKDNILVAHCNSKYNNVTINTADEAGFMYFRRPAILVD
ncbi:C40 family peptidase [Maledivibacter halophilus]|uniref:Cell wall-associated hydrolases (Invasion-associated proteins) n=1 Tax=Maledivibacter halophilus TaxID=36842 RepID=A0A1T5LNM0_9FIRM|nr:NlpC/P60 family protein [Maledivibacter halophilus]SKC77597.1 Cell wall-associated hydrolases (invasion-associated proteins) [Maledivibacter halophilus]